MDLPSTWLLNVTISTLYLTSELHFKLSVIAYREKHDLLNVFLCLSSDEVEQWFSVLYDALKNRPHKLLNSEVRLFVLLPYDDPKQQLL